MIRLKNGVSFCQRLHSMLPHCYGAARLATVYKYPTTTFSQNFVLTPRMMSVVTQPVILQDSKEEQLAHFDAVLQKFEKQHNEIPAGELFKMLSDIHEHMYGYLSKELPWVNDPNISALAKALDLISHPGIEDLLQPIWKHPQMENFLNTLNSKREDLSNDELIRAVLHLRLVLLDWYHPLVTTFYSSVLSRAQNQQLVLENYPLVVVFARVLRDHYLTQLVLEHQRQILAELEQPNPSKVFTLPECILFARTLLGTCGAFSHDFGTRCVSQVIYCLTQATEAERATLTINDIILLLQLIVKLYRYRLCERQVTVKLGSMLLSMSHSRVPDMSVDDVSSIFELVHKSKLYGDLDIIKSVETHLADYFNDSKTVEDFTLSQLCHVAPLIKMSPFGKSVSNSNWEKHLVTYLKQRDVRKKLSPHMLLRLIHAFSINHTNNKELQFLIQKFIIDELPRLCRNAIWTRHIGHFIEDHKFIDPDHEQLFIDTMFDYATSNSVVLSKSTFYLGSLFNAIVTRARRRYFTDTRTLSEDEEERNLVAEAEELRFTELLSNLSHTVDIFVLKNIGAASRRHLPMPLKSNLNKTLEYVAMRVANTIDERKGIYTIDNILRCIINTGMHVDHIHIESILNKFLEYSKCYSAMDVRVIASSLRDCKCYHPTIMNNLVDSLLTRVRDPQQLTIQMVLNTCAMTGVIPKHIDDFTQLCLEATDAYRDHDYCINQVTMVYNLAKLDVYPEKYVTEIFSLNFLEELDSFMKNRPGKMYSVKDVMMHLNRSVVLECPELNIPWFNDVLVQEKIEKHNRTKEYYKKSGRNKYKTRLHREIAEVIHAVVPMDCIQEDFINHYGYNIDFQINFNKHRKPLPVSSSEIPADRVAIRVYPQHFYCFNARKLYGMELVSPKQLQMMGYTVIQVPYYEWNSMGLQSSASRIEFMEDKLGIS